MSKPSTLAELETRREQLLEQLASVGDLRPGTLAERFRKCGKPTCHCARAGDPGHGPVWTLVFTVAGKTKNRVIPADAVARTRAQIAECKRLRSLTSELIEVSEAAVPRAAGGRPGRGGSREKGGFAATVAAESAAEGRAA